MKWFLISLLLFLNACSGLPKTMGGNSYSSLSLLTVKANIPSHINSHFRWGGTVINVVNEKDASQIQFLFYPLSRYGRPQTDQQTEGRFAITSPQFLDPAIYKEGVEITVTGILSGKLQQKIGNKTLQLPLLSLENIHIWPEYQQQGDRFYSSPYGAFSPYYYPYHRYPSFHDYYY